MQVAFIVLNNTGKLDELLQDFMRIGIKGATVIDSTGMGGLLASSHKEDIPFFTSIRMMMGDSKPLNKTIFSVIEDEQIPLLVEAFEKIVGKISEPNTGIIFTIPISFVKGVKIS